MTENNQRQVVEPPPAAAPAKRRWWLVAIGFVGWYLVNGYIWWQYVGKFSLTPWPSIALDDNSYTKSYQLIFNIFLFPSNLVLLLVLAIIRPTRPLALGILLAFSVNLIISLFLGLGNNALCLIPFFVR